MSRPRFSLGTLLLMVLFAGVAFAALKSPSDTWASALFTAAVAVLLVAVLLAVHRRDRGRAYWLGFALFGWVYFILSLVPETAPRLATTGLLDALFARVHGHTGEVVSVDFLRQGRRLGQRGAGSSPSTRSPSHPTGSAGRARGSGSRASGSGTCPRAGRSVSHPPTRKASGKSVTRSWPC